jgi:adapter protein MecA 1/2
MKINRINETTIKFLLTEEELQARGIDHEEIWCDRETGEKLFFDMMEEAYQQMKFQLDGPLWIEAHMYDDGVEILVTKGKKDTSVKLSEEGDYIHPALEQDKGGDQNMMNHEMYSSQLENRSQVADQQSTQKKSIFHSSVYKFKDIEDVIQLAHRLTLPFFNSKLVRFNQAYYLIVMYPEQKLVRGKDWIESLVLEYGERGHTTTHRLEEYGKEIMSENAIATIKNYFKILA